MHVCAYSYMKKYREADVEAMHGPIPKTLTPGFSSRTVVIPTTGGQAQAF